MMTLAFFVKKKIAAFLVFAVQELGIREETYLSSKMPRISLLNNREENGAVFICKKQFIYHCISELVGCDVLLEYFKNQTINLQLLLQN